MTEDYIERLQRAEAALDQLIYEAVESRHDTEEARLRGKREGVQLALSYALEEARLVD